MAGVFFIGFMAAYFTISEPLFNDPASTVLTDRSGELMNAMIASDGQWRFPEIIEVPKSFEKAILQFEDRYFYYHPGVNPVSLARALYLNISEGEIVSGASTLSMQVIRLWRNNQPRSISEKVIEIFYALALELKYSKKQILALYASHAPFGGNVVGLSAASWRYFNRPPDQLSYAEAAALAVLPNQPALIYPGRNDDMLRRKRNNLLRKLQSGGQISKQEFELALLEDTPKRPQPLPGVAPHLLTRAIQDGYVGQKIRTTVNAGLQKRLNQVVHTHHKKLSANKIHNAAVLIADVNTSEVIAYAGNTQDDVSTTSGGHDVDIITSPRSSGSILKPFLYLWLLDRGELLPDMLVSDIPVNYQGYRPQNYNKTYHGAVPASQALAQSLNVPAVRLLQSFGVSRFYDYLKQMDISTLHSPPEHYGLSLILGGAEVTLWDLAGAYRSMAGAMRQSVDFENSTTPFRPANLRYRYKKENNNNRQGVNAPKVDIGAVWAVLNAMKEVKRPGAEFYWKQFSSAQPVSWKTGTSFGHRDAWAVGVTEQFVVAVWAGNADGEGRPGLTGLHAAAPIMFDAINLLPELTWFEKPIYAMEKAPICSRSGHLSGWYCSTSDVDTLWIPKAGLKTTSCPYHKQIHLSQDKKHRVHSGCASLADANSTNWFELPATEAWYYDRIHPEYEPIPDFHPACQPVAGNYDQLDIIYPHSGTAIYIPKEVDGKREKAVFEAVHSNREMALYWHINDTFVRQTTGEHKIALRLKPGRYDLTVVDERGNAADRQFEILED